ncbi:MAG: GNAT family N-acetyltransferase [Hyphomicrobiaceae bacterium]
MPDVSQIVEVRMLGPDDLDLLIDTPEGVFDDPLRPVRAAEFLGDPRHLLMAAIEDKRIIGFASAVLYVHPDKPSPELWINEVSVLQTHHRRGIGRRLIGAMVAAARAKDCSQVWVQTETGNVAARALYRACGAWETDGVVHYEFKLE